MKCPKCGYEIPPEDDGLDDESLYSRADLVRIIREIWQAYANADGAPELCDSPGGVQKAAGNAEINGDGEQDKGV